MKILFDALGLPSYGGAKTSALGWIYEIAVQEVDHEFIAVLSEREPILEEVANLEQHVAPPMGRLKVRVWAQCHIPYMVRTCDVDLVHFTKNHGCFFLPCPTVITVNDLNRLYYPRMFSHVDVFYWKTLQRLLFKQMSRIIAISKNTKRDILRFYGLPDEKVKVIYPAVSPIFQEPHTSVDKASPLLQRYGIRLPYILSVGGFAVHKNVYTALRAFYTLLAQGYLSDYTFVIVGEQVHTHNDQRLFELAAQHQNKQICFTGSVETKVLPLIYSRASLFIYPSLYEGFGIAPLEAMACGVPVLASRAGSLPEVLGDAAYLVEDALDVAGFAEAMLEMLSNSATWKRYRLQGLENVRRFSWAQTARQTLALYQTLVHNA